MSLSADFALASAVPSDAPAIAALLRDAGLPAADISPHLATFIVARHADAIVGVIGAELCGEAALLRSLVVAPAHRGGGLGSRLFAALDRAAAGWGVHHWWLLTSTAEAFFTARGFHAASRGDAPAAIRQTGQFNGGCCASAACLTRSRAASA